MRVMRILLALVLLLGTPVAAATYEEIPLPGVTKRADGIAIDGAGRVFVTATDAWGVLRYDPATKSFDLAAFTTPRIPDASLRGLAWSPRGGLWTAEPGWIHVVNATRLTERTIPISDPRSEVTDVHVDGLDRVWLVMPAAARTLRVDPGSDGIVPIEGPGTGFEPQAVAGADQGIRIVDRRSGTAASAEGTRLVAATGGFRDPVAADLRGGELWVAEIRDATLARTTAGIIDRFPLPGSPASGSAPGDVVLDVAGRAWFTQPGAGRIGWIDPAAGTVVSYRLSTASEPRRLAAANDGAMWATDYGAGRLVRLVAWDAPAAFERPGALEVRAGKSIKLTLTSDGLSAGADGDGLTATVSGGDVVVRASGGARVGPHRIFVGAEGADNRTAGWIVAVDVLPKSGLPGFETLAGVVALAAAAAVGRRVNRR